MSAAVLDVNFHLSLGCLHCLGVAFSMAVDPQDLDPRLGRCGCGHDGGYGHDGGCGHDVTGGEMGWLR